jgi:hypothetical protein
MTARDKNRIAVLGTILGAAELMVGSDPSAARQSPSCSKIAAPGVYAAHVRKGAAAAASRRRRRFKV